MSNVINIINNDVISDAGGATDAQPLGDHNGCDPSYNKWSE